MEWMRKYQQPGFPRLDKRGPRNLGKGLDGLSEKRVKCRQASSQVPPSLAHRDQRHLRKGGRQ